MKLKSIKLKNIGLYKNELIEFPYAGNNNTIVVWGNNGAGKTTLINSVKVGLLGKDAVQMTYPDYCQFVKSKMISTRCNLIDSDASIEIEAEINDDNRKNVYRICRSWTEKNGVFQENEQMFCNSALLPADERDYIANVISRSLPHSLLDVIVFDGENAINILNEGMMSKLIKGILFSVFGMDVYSSLSKDLSSFLRSAKSNSDITATEQMDLIRAESEYRTALKNNKKLESLTDRLKKNRVDKLIEISFSLKRFSDKTGISVDEIDGLNRKLSEANLNKEKMNSDLRYLNEEVLPLKLVHKRIKSIIKEINSNKPYKAFAYLEKLKEFFIYENDAQEWISNLEKLLPNEIKEIKYDLNDTELRIIENVDKVLDGYTAESMLNAIENKNDYLKDIRYKILISNKVEAKESQELLRKLEILYSELEIIDSELAKLNDDFAKSELIVLETKKAYSDLKYKVTKQKKESSSYITAIKYRDAIDEFIEENIKDICSKVNSILKTYLEDMRFRNNSIGNVEISPKNFEINLYESDGSIIPSYLFSAGEKQVLLGLVIKAALSLTAVDSFFLFDTPVGRLDKGNRELFTKEVIFSVSEQSFVFATDSDYSEEDYKKISSSISAEYKLRRNEQDEIIAVKGSIY